jgi:hypothetical protein
MATASREFTERIDGELRVDDRRVTFATTTSTQTAFVYSGAYQQKLTSRLWVRGGLGVGTFEREIVLDDADLTLNLSKGQGLAFVAAAGVKLPSLWSHPREVTDLQVHYLTYVIKGMRVHAPTVQIGFTWR